MPVITWKTHKTEAGFRWLVFSFGYQIPTETLKEGVCRTRAQATGQARRWSLYLKAQQRKAA